MFCRRLPLSLWNIEFVPSQNTGILWQPETNNKTQMTSVLSMSSSILRPPAPWFGLLAWEASKDMTPVENGAILGLKPFVASCKLDQSGGGIRITAWTLITGESAAGYTWLHSGSSVAYSSLDDLHIDSRKSHHSIAIHHFKPERDTTVSRYPS